ncbi:MAG: hypothetical protein HY753_08330 [Nitrospirae bacterium]|nr:hypothetical protein [Nitrospirota bacterium]
MKVADMSTDELKALIKVAVKEEIEETLEIKHRLFELETIQSLKEVEEGKVKAFDSVDEMLRDIEKNEI